VAWIHTYRPHLPTAQPYLHQKDREFRSKRFGTVDFVIRPFCDPLFRFKRVRMGTAMHDDLGIPLHVVARRLLV
jgi:hypothetical protein